MVCIQFLAVGVAVLFCYNPKDFEDYFLVMKIQAFKIKSKGRLKLHHRITVYFTHTYIEHKLMSFFPSLLPELQTICWRIWSNLQLLWQGQIMCIFLTLVSLLICLVLWVNNTHMTIYTKNNTLALLYQPQCITDVYLMCMFSSGRCFFFFFEHLLICNTSRTCSVRCWMGC